MSTQPDSRRVRRHDDEHLRRFVRARAGRDAAAMRRWWEELVIDFADRMDGLVAATHKGRLDDDEHELAVQAAMIRFAHNLIHSFEGASMGELVNATKKLAWFACVDVQQDAVARRERFGGSFDDGWDAAGEDAPPAPRWQYDVALRESAREQDARDVTEFLAWALPQVPESRRRVLELSFEGVALDEICAELELSSANAYQRRSRGIKDLRRLKELYEA